MTRTPDGAKRVHDRFATRNRHSFRRKAPTMTQLWDEFSKSLAESVPRRESLRRFGAMFAGAALGSLGMESAWAGKVDPCKSFCRCSNKTQQNQCLAACKTCQGNTSRLGGSCGKYVCCPTASCRGVCSDLKSDPNCGACGYNCADLGESCCGNYCADLANDFDNCGGCGMRCDEPAPFEQGACVQGACVYECAEGADDCGDGTCIDLGFDPDNCGACGNVCGASTPYCNQGACSMCVPWHEDCGGYCANLANENTNCGACGWVCDVFSTCVGGVCQPVW